MTGGFSVTDDPDVDAVVATLVEAFRDDPVLVWTVPHGTAERDRWLDGFFRATTEMLLAHDGRVGCTPGHEAVAVWSPPGEPTLDEAEEDRWHHALVEATGPCAERATILMAALDEAYPAALPPHVHVMFAAARPEPSARGAGVMLLRGLTRREGDPGLGLYAEASTPQNLALWQEMGMRRVGGEIVLPDGPPLFPIWRPGAPPASPS